MKNYFKNAEQIVEKWTEFYGGFIFLVPAEGEFYFGDGLYETITPSLQTTTLRGECWVPVNPMLTIGYSSAGFSGSRFSVRVLETSEVEDINSMTAENSKEELYFRDTKPKQSQIEKLGLP